MSFELRKPPNSVQGYSVIELDDREEVVKREYGRHGAANPAEYDDPPYIRTTKRFGLVKHLGDGSERLIAEGSEDSMHRSAAAANGALNRERTRRR